MKAPLFTKDELKSFNRYPLAARKRRIENEFRSRIALPSYSMLSGFDKYQYCSSEIAQLRGENQGCLSGGCLGLILGSASSAVVGGPLGIFLFFVIASIGGYLGNELGKGNADHLIQLLEREQKQYQLEFEKENEKRLKAAQAEKNAQTSRQQAEAAKAKLEVNNTIAEERKILDSKARDAVNANAARESERLHLIMLKQPGLVKQHFTAYKEYVNQELEGAWPDTNAISQAQFNRGMSKALLSGMLGIGIGDYTPSQDKKFTALMSVLERERTRIKRLAHNAGLPYIAIEHFQEVSRTYYGLQRPGGKATIYDETMIQNEVIAMKESLNIQGDYVDNSLRIDRSINTTTNIESAVLEPDNMSPERIKKEIIKSILSSKDEAMSRLELLAVIAAKESEISASLEELQINGTIRIFNRDSGEIVYGIDRFS